MTTEDIFELADACIREGYFPALVGRRYVLLVAVPGTGRSVIHREEVSFRLHCPCRVWLVSGRLRILLGDSEALPGDFTKAPRPPWTG